MSEQNTAEKNALDTACAEAAEAKGYAWLSGVLQGAIGCEWTAARLIDFLRAECHTPSAVS